ncbi:MAG TPA: PilW family protein [Steroidobacteraceae bacterium]|nr:PilW family protein [Steroidobacteraceae bacterium]
MSRPAVRRAAQRGFSVVELMVAMTLSLVLLAGALGLTYSSRVTFRENERVGRLQESGRFALELIGRDLRAAGFAGCMRGVDFINNLNTPTDLLWNFAVPLQGFESTGPGAWSPAVPAEVVSPRDDSDILVVRTAQTQAALARMLTNVPMANSLADLAIDKDPSDTLAIGQPILVGDCTAASVFAVSAFANAGATATVSHAAGGAAGVGPGNSTADLGPAYRDGAEVTPIDTVIYYIRDSDTVRNGVRNPSLWRIVGARPAVELVEGVDAMQLQYGEDTNGDRRVDTYVAADAVGNWNRVIAISLALLVRSTEPNALEPDTQTYTLLGTPVGPFNDRYQRTMFTTTVTLRNATT